MSHISLQTKQAYTLYIKSSNAQDAFHLILSTLSCVCYFLSLISADTTDVQYAQVEYDSETIAVTCNFAEGSKALGCHVQLNFSNNPQVLNISREDGSLIHSRTLRLSFHLTAISCSFMCMTGRLMIRWEHYSFL